MPKSTHFEFWGSFGLQFELFGCRRAKKPFWGEALGALAKPALKRKIWGRNRDFDKNRKIQRWRQKHEKLRASGARWPLGPSKANLGVDFFAMYKKNGGSTIRFSRFRIGHG